MEVNVNKPIISVIVPCHNVENWLERCVDSLLNQTLQGVEIILVENGSHDNTPTICKEYANKFENVKYLELDYGDLSSARNVGVKHATGKWVAFVDSDDWIEPDTYEVMLSEMQRTDQQIGYYIYRYEWPDGRIWDQIEADGKSVVESTRELQQKVIVNERQLGACCMIFTKGFFDDHVFPKGKFMEDYSTLYRWIGEFETILCKRSAFYHYVQHDNGIMSSAEIAPKRLVDFIEAELGRIKYLLENNLFDRVHEFRKAHDLILDHCLCHLQTYLLVTKSLGLCKDYMGIRKRLLDITSGVRNYGKGKKMHIMMMKYVWPLHCIFLKYIWRRNNK